MFIADFHIHSKYARATSGECVPEMLDAWGRRKGLHLIGTGDFTHPKWRQELKDKLIPAEEGLYRLRPELRLCQDVVGVKMEPRFILSGEISSIYKKGGKVRKVHNVILLPTLEAGEALARRLEAIGNLHSDGRPILGLDSRDLLEITLTVCPEAMFIPAHIWTPHFSLFGAYSGFDRIEDCFGDLTSHICALETGLSSDPPMNWRLSMLDKFTLVSNSDAHSPGNLAREANVFNCGLSYGEVSQALSGEDPKGFRGTLEFFPEEGKYHWDGHRSCKVCLKPEETRAYGGRCPVCGGRITVGVLSRVEELADRPEGFRPDKAKDFERLTPLPQVLAASMGVGEASGKVARAYEALTASLGPELFLLREAPLEEIRHKAGVLVEEGIRRLRLGQVELTPGYDGEYGRIKLFEKDEMERLLGQVSFVEGQKAPGRKRKAPEAPAAPAEALKEPAAAQPMGGLNPEQDEAVRAEHPAIAVIAGPGTGKTKTLVSRILYLIQERKVPPARITAVTFTNKAAAEMRQRLAKELGGRRAAGSVTVGTFHAIALKLLAGEGGQSPAILDEADGLAVLKEILAEKKLPNPPKEVLRGISLMKNGLLPEENLVPPGVYDAYGEALKLLGVLDYDDILLEALKRSQEGEPPACFQYLMVDEFQDINDLQYRLIQAWSADGAEVFIIGDPDQAIYGFRGANPRCFDRFFADHPGALLIRLARNYRSTPEILRSAQSGLHGSSPALTAMQESGLPVRLVKAEDEYAQALFIAREIGRMVGGMDMISAHGAKAADRQGRGFSDIALLYRTNRQAETIERCLKAEDIPYRVAGRGDFLDDPQVRKALAFFRFALEPGDMHSLRICLGEGIVSPRKLQEVIREYEAKGKSPSLLPVLLKDCADPSGSLARFVRLQEKYAPLAAQGKPVALLSEWMKDMDLKEEGALSLLSATAVMQESMASLLKDLTLGQEGDVVRSGGRRYTPDAVSLMTLHGAKGLEFPVVFLCGVTDGLIPHRGRDGTLDLMEERRLFYVGMTRAREELILMTYGEPSPFLTGLPAQDMSREEAFAAKQATAFEQCSFL